MTIKSSKELVNDALKEIKTISHTEASKLHKDGSCNLIDIRDVRELEKEGRVEGSLQYLVKSWSTIVELISVWKRLREFEDKLNESITLGKTI